MQLASKPHYPILDGLRGVAALLVVAFHILESHSTSHLDLMINHGYLAVDFFFLLSGFVVAYAYDDRWSKMSIGGFFKRRLVRLQPLVVMGMLIGALCFYFQDSVLWPGIHEVPVWKLILVTLIGFTLLPLPISMDIRGWQEMHPLNGPGWSLFFEYIANILYALFVRKFSNKALTLLVFLSACFLVHLSLTSKTGDIIGGWSLNLEQLHIGFARVMYPFFAGLLLCRTVKLVKVKNAFFWSSLLILVVFSIPRIGGAENLWMNAIYDVVSVIVFFPVIVWLGAGGEVTGKYATKICKFLGDISYPIYMTHFPLVCIYNAWVADHKMPLKEAYPMGILVFLSAVLLAWVCLKWYDEPVRAWLKKKVFSAG
eukprot:gene12567-14747_t